MSFKISRRVEFRDTDAAGIVHFSAFFVYMEQAEHELLRRLGFSVVVRDSDGEISWPRVAAACDYLSPAKFEDILDVEVIIERLGTRSVKYGFSFRRGEKEVARGTLTSVCCRIRHGRMPESIDIPVEIADKLRALSPADD